MKYEIRQYEAEAAVSEYVDRCVDIPYFLGLCRQCENYGKVWSCPPYDFDPLEYWGRYETLRVIGRKIIIPDELRERVLTPAEQEAIPASILWDEKARLNDVLWELEKEIPGSVLLSAGNCRECAPRWFADTTREERWGYCARAERKACRHPERVRYSIESIGGDVTKTVEYYLKQKIQWIRDGRLPEYFFLVAGLLQK